jgi:metallophosphoesterase superfamily enzyme
VKSPAPAAETHALADGVVAVAPGLAWLVESRALLVADAHLAYEDVVGGALPLWSTAEIVTTLGLVAARVGAREIVFLGDIVHGSMMSDGAMRVVRDGLDVLRARCVVTLIAGNHEGKSRAFRVLGATIESCERDGWLLVHGDRAPILGTRTIIGHLHPSLHLGGGAAVPAFVASDMLVCVPAFTPYSSGLDVLSDDFARAIAHWNVERSDAHVVAVTDDRVLPFGSLSTLRSTLRARASQPAPAHVPRQFRRRLRPSS